MNRRDFVDIATCVAGYVAIVTIIFENRIPAEQKPMCDTAERELVCRSISFGPVDPYTKEGEAKYGNNWQTVRNSYAPGGACFNSMSDSQAYYSSHTVPSSWGWKWANNTWNPPPEGDPKGMVWNGKNFVQGPTHERPSRP